MEKKRIFKIINVVVTIIMISAILFVLIKPEKTNGATQEIAQCIGEKAVLYTQLGCSHCEDQEKMFGENLEYITKIDCFFEMDKCDGVAGTPTWEIGNKKIIGFKTIEELRELTSC